MSTRHPHRRAMVSHRSNRSQNGAALLLAMVIVTLVATLAASMVWQQWRAVQVESAERARSQAAWMLAGALDWARLILKEDAKGSNQTDDLTEVWAQPLAEARVSSFLAVDKDNSASDNDEMPDAFLSGRIQDASGKFNLIALINSGTNGALGDISKEQLLALQRLCQNVGLSAQLADGIAQSIRTAVLSSYSDAEALKKLGGEQARAAAPLLPQSIDQLNWLRLDAATVERLRPFVVILPDNSDNKVNVNTAPPEVIAAVVPGLDLGRAQRIAQARQRKPFKAPGEIANLVGQIMGPTGPLDYGTYLTTKSEFFQATVRLRLEDNVIEQRYLLQRKDREVAVLQQSRFSGVEPSASP